MELKEQQKINKVLQKKISENEQEMETLQEMIQNKDKTHLTSLSKSELKYQQLSEQV